MAHSSAVAQSSYNLAFTDPSFAVAHGVDRSQGLSTACGLLAADVLENVGFPPLGGSVCPECVAGVRRIKVRLHELAASNETASRGLDRV
jgi:hypothetical protein